MRTETDLGGLRLWVCGTLLAIGLPLRSLAAEAPQVEELRTEVAKKGWILIAAYEQEVQKQQRLSDHGVGQADLYVMRPDGSEMRNLTNTPDVHEFFVRISPDGQKIMYRRMPKGKGIDHDSVGTQGELVIANVDGSNPVAYGTAGQYPWATWSPDLKQIACLEQDREKKQRFIRIYDLATKQLVKEMPDHGIFQQMSWSSDGRSLCGTANVRGMGSWNIISLDLESQQFKVLTRHFNCTPLWLRDSSGVVNSTRNPAWGRKGGGGRDYGNTVLTQATADGKQRKLIYADIDVHVYNGFPSPDGKYVAFNTGASEGGTQGDPNKQRCFYIVRLADTPIIQPGFDVLKDVYPDARTGPALQVRFPNGTPMVTVFLSGDWTYAEIGARK